MEGFIKLSSDFNDHYIKEFNTELEYVEKFSEIKIDLLEKTYGNHEQREMTYWLHGQLDYINSSIIKYETSDIEYSILS
jgi:hypothetical protein